MTMHRPILIAGLSLATLLLGTSSAPAAVFSCSTVNRQDLFDVDGDRLSSKFDHPDVNSTGDVVFSSRTKDGAHKLYLRPVSGTGSVVAAEGQAAPGGGTFSQFDDASINDNGDIGFSAGTSPGKGIFVRPQGGSVRKAVRNGDASPAGGTFFSFLAVSDVNDDGDSAFIAQVTGGPGGVFVYDTSANTITASALVGGATGGGKTFCGFSNVTLGGGGRTAFQALTETTCGVSNDGVFVIFQDNGPGFTAIAQKGGATPIAGTTYGKLFDVDSNGADEVAFRAKIVGSINATAVFLFNPAGPATTTIIRTGTAAPVSGGTLKAFSRIGGLTDFAAVAIRATIVGGTAKQGVFIFDGGGEAAVLSSSTVPTDFWGASASYRKINEDTGISASGGWITFSAKVKDRETPSGTGLFRCHGV
jgi:hypothetical protein